MKEGEFHEWCENLGGEVDIDVYGSVEHHSCNIGDSELTLNVGTDGSSLSWEEGNTLSETYNLKNMEFTGDGDIYTSHVSPNGDEFEFIVRSQRTLEYQSHMK